MLSVGPGWKGWLLEFQSNIEDDPEKQRNALKEALELIEENKKASNLSNLYISIGTCRRFATDVLEKLATAAWYLHSTRDGKLYFRNVQNLNAKLESLVRAYAPEQAVKELRERLKQLFLITNGWCYQKIQVLPALHG